jgi:hypothetical protein
MQSASKTVLFAPSGESAFSQLIPALNALTRMCYMENIISIYRIIVPKRKE